MAEPIPPEYASNCAEHPDEDVYYDNMAHAAPCECPGPHPALFHHDRGHRCDLYLDDRHHEHLRGWGGDPDEWRCQSCRDAHSVLRRASGAAVAA